MSSPAGFIDLERNKAAPHVSSVVWPFFKRLLDLLGALALLIVFSPIIATSVVTLGLCGGDILFTQWRVGRGGKAFRCYKFRTMIPDAEEFLKIMIEQDPAVRAEWQRDQKLRYDPRITRIGSFLRKTSLDELPQLINVFKGDMSLVGPRPAMTCQIDLYGRAARWYCSVRPGITGLWQVTARGDSDFRRRTALDCYYARRNSFSMDMSILVRTVWVVLSAKGAR